jgi:hypothetical protein
MIEEATDPWWKSLFSDAGAQWAVLLSGWGAAAWQFFRRRAQFLVVREVSAWHAVNPGVAVKSRVRITFDDKPVSTLGQIDVTLRNEGSDVIRDWAVTLGVTGGADCQILDAIVVSAPKGLCAAFEGRTVEITAQFLNAYREHKEEAHVRILTAGPAWCASARGSGVGWSVKFLDEDRLDSTTEWKSTLMVWTPVLLCALVTTAISRRFYSLATGVVSGAALNLAIHVVRLNAIYRRRQKKRRS